MEVDFEMRDGMQKTMMRHAMENERVDCIEFLAKCGAECSDVFANAPLVVRARVQNAKNKINEIREEYREAITEVSPLGVHDLNELVLYNLSDYCIAEGKQDF